MVATAKCIRGGVTALQTDLWAGTDRKFGCSSASAIIGSLQPSCETAHGNRRRAQSLRPDQGLP